MPPSPTVSSAPPTSGFDRDSGPRREIFGHRQRGLQRVLMAEIVGLFADAGIRIAARERQAARGSPHQAGDQPQQRGLAGAVRPPHQQGLARGEAEAQARKTVRPPRIQASSEARSPIERINPSCRRAHRVSRRRPGGRIARSGMSKIRAFSAHPVDEKSIIWNRAKKDLISPIRQGVRRGRPDVAAGDKGAPVRPYRFWTPTSGLDGTS